VKILSPELLEEILAQSADPSEPDRVNGALRSSKRSRLRLAADALIRRADGVLVRLDELVPPTPVFCPFHLDGHPSAFVVASRHGVKGLHCSACDTSYFPADEGEYDFGHFERVARAAHAYYQAHQDRGPLFNQTKVHRGLQDCRITVTTGRAAPLALQQGITFIKSYKGSGKTEALKRFAAASKGDVILIGHRRALIGQSAKRVGLANYLGLPDGGLTASRLAVCLDSLARVGHHRTFELVILDESEQLLAHFLSDTLGRHGEESRWRLFLRFQRIIAMAKYVVALDADLGWVTYRTLTSMVRDGDPRRANGMYVPKPRHLWINTPAVAEQKAIRIYDRQNQQLGALKEAIAGGKRCFVSSNSRTKMEAFAEVLSAEFPDRRVLLITSGTSSNPDVQAFIKTPAVEALNYDLILASPSIGTGVDITFPDAAPKIDAVFGFFEPRINTHFDMDQQIGRVRHPGETNVWIDKRRYRFETNVDVVRSNVLAQGLYRDLLIGYDPDGRPVFEKEDLFIETASAIVSEQIASKNDLKSHFIRHKESQGFVIERIGPDPVLEAAGKAALVLGRELRDEKYAGRILAASPLQRADFKRVADQLKGDELVPEPTRWDFARTRMELFYRETVTPDLIVRDDRGRFRSQILAFENVTTFAAHAAKGFGPIPDPARPVPVLPREMRFLPGSGGWVIFNALGLTPLLVRGEFQKDAIVNQELLRPFAEFLLTTRPLSKTSSGLRFGAT
jgi:hypothetical protein